VSFYRHSVENPTSPQWKRREEARARLTTAFEVCSNRQVPENEALAVARNLLEALRFFGQARADAERVKIEAEASADAEAIRITRVATANAESIAKVNAAIQAGGESYFRYRQIELLPQIAPVIASALAEARLINISSDGTSAAEGATNNITSVIQTVLAAQLVSKSGIGEGK